MLLGQALGADIPSFLANFKEELIDFIFSEIGVDKIRPGKMGAQIILLNRSVRDKTRSPALLGEMRKKVLETPIEEIWNLAAFEEMTRQFISQIQRNFNDHGILCTSTNKDNLLMWAHYADHHRGVVLELCPDQEKDSALLASRPVIYAAQRPVLYQTPREFIEKTNLWPLEEVSRVMNESLIYTKSTEWSYGEEYRLAIPRFIPHGKTEEYLDLNPTEISHIYFGCRVTEQQRDQLKLLARTLNSEISFSRAVLDKRAYALEWLDAN